jgi:uncharacterized protein involved in outer membrane biogenesis
MLNKIKPASARRKPATAPSLRPSSRRALLLWRAGIGVAVFLILFAVVGFFAVPPIARYYLAKELTKRLDRQVTVERVDVNPFSMTAAIRGLSIKERDASEVFVSLAALELNLQAESIYRRAPILREVKLTDPYVHVVRNADARTYNFSDLIEKFSRPKPSPGDKAAEAPRFSLNNVQIVNGRIEIDDRPKHARHSVREINIAIPFLSNLPYLIEDYVQPSFSARVNDTPFALHGRTKPFKDTLETSVDIDIQNLNIPRYMEYVPLDLAFRVPSGMLDSKLTASFVRSQSRGPVLSVRGSASLREFRLAELDGQPLLNLQRIDVPVTTIDVFGRKYAFGSIALQSPEVFVRRARDGGVNWLAVIPRREAPAPAPDQSARPNELSVLEVKVEDGQVHVRDLVPEKGFKHDLAGIQASLRRFSVPQTEAAQVEVAFHSGLGEQVKASGSLKLSPLASEGVVEANHLPLVDYQPYYQDYILYRFEDGVCDLATQYSFTTTDQGPAVKLSAFNLALASLRLRKPGEDEDFLRAKTAQIKDASVDVRALVLNVGQFTTRGGFLNVIREADGGLNATRILPAPKEAAPAGQQGTPWLVTLQRADAQKWKVAFTDLTLQEPVRIVADDVTLKAAGVSNQKGRNGRIELSARLNETGTLAVSGPLALNPVRADLKLDLKDFGLVPLQPYFADRVNVLITSADLSATGQTSFAVPPQGQASVAFDGEVALTNFASVDKATSEDFLKWNILVAGGIAYQHNPMRLAIEQVALSDFYSRIIVHPEGRLNLQNVMAGPPEEATATAEQPEAQPATTAEAGRGGPPPAVAEKTEAVPAAQRAPTVQPASAAGTESIRIGKVTLQGGDVNFTDLFIKPNYSANLTEIGGAVTGLSSQLDTAADVDLHGRFAGTAPVQIQGKVNPLVRNLFLDIKANVHDIELGPFTPYSGKYVGYAIEKGKLRFDVAYKIENRKLAASNQIVIDQLTFGGKVESPQATKLPVLLAVALLKDRNGVIDVNLPISGSLDDPKFSLGGLIIRVIINLITKVITAPFALLAGLAGGGDGAALSYVQFEPGRSALSTDAQNKVTTVTKGLVDRPALKVDLIPHVDPQGDREGLRRYRFEQQVKAQKVADMVKRGETVKSVDEVKIEPGDYEKYLRRAYKQATFSKPRNFIGMQKDLPTEEMEKLMLTNTTVSDDDLVQLANQRGQTVKEAITRGGEVSLERVFLIAPKLEAGKADAAAKGPRVDLALK